MLQVPCVQVTLDPGDLLLAQWSMATTDVIDMVAQVEGDRVRVAFRGRDVPADAPRIETALQDLFETYARHSFQDGTWHATGILPIARIQHPALQRLLAAQRSETPWLRFEGGCVEVMLLPHDDMDLLILEAETLQLMGASAHVQIGHVGLEELRAFQALLPPP